MARGDFASAAALLATDSTVEGRALQGRLALYRGDLAGARIAFREAGPFAGGQAAATGRSALLAMIQPIERDSLPELGTAFLALARHDSATAVTRLTQVAQALGPAGGGAELLVYAGRLEAKMGHDSAAEALFRRAITPEAPGAAAAADLELGRLYIAQARNREAITALEHLVLNYSGSPLVPQARRLMDQAKGVVPGT